jgi:hypothetical protein
MIQLLCTILVLLFSAITVAEESTCPHHSEHQKQVNERGDGVMGFKNSKTIHHFQLWKNGGVIRVEAKDEADVESIGKIRKHLREITTQFSKGEFSLPEEIHGRVPPGVPEMIKHQHSITYNIHEIANGGEIRIKTEKPEALDALHAFLRFQIEDHRTGDPITIQ